MIHAVFIDYTGTTIQESGMELKEVVARICKNSTLRQPRDVMNAWWGLVKQYENSSFGDSYLTEDEIVDRALLDLVKTFQLKENLAELHRLTQDYWVNAPLFPDVREFYETCPLPLFVISNNGIQYVEKAMKRNRLCPTGIVCADMVRAYKPHKELFEKALDVSGFRADQVIHIGDSFQSDVQGAASAGIQPVLLQRSGNRRYEGITTVQALYEVLDLLK